MRKVSFSLDPVPAVSKRAKLRRACILSLLFALSTLFYYFGEVIDLAGWNSIRWDFFYGVHDVHRLLFLAPIIYAGYHFRVKGAAIISAATLIAFLPRAIFLSPFPDPLLRAILFIIVAAFIGVLTGMVRNDVERRSRLEALVRSERDKLMGILDRMEEGVFIVGPDYRIRFLNSSMKRDFGEGKGSLCYEYLSKLDSPCKICKLPEVLKGSVERWEYTSSRGGRVYEILASPYVDSDGVVCQLATFRNITQRKKVETELIELNRLKSELVSHVSHELKSPLTSIKGIISSLLQKDIKWDDESREMLLTGISEETDRLTSLVTNLLNMSKLEAGVWQPDKERCSVSDIIVGVLEQQKWVHKKHTFRVNLPADLPDVYADYSQIRQVLINLLENAAAYSDEGTEVILDARVADGTVEVSVSDHGVGIPEEDMEKIFNKFFRGSQERKKPGGTGLGLAISKALIQANGGRIWAESKVGQGSTFYFTLLASDKAVVGANEQKVRSSGR